ncbi:MAG: AMP phosphorylase [Candidatus Nanoarchaeia archaeon]
MNIPLKAKLLHISTGGPLIVTVNRDDSRHLDLHTGDRLLVRCGRKSITAILDITYSSSVVPKGHLGLFEEVGNVVAAKSGKIVKISLEEKPDAVRLIRKKMYGFHLSPSEMKEIVNAVGEHRLTSVEMSYFIAAGFMRGMDLDEIVSLAKAMIASGETLKINKRVILDKHCIGGVAGNRTTPIVVAILAAAGFTVPKTSSRAITSPAGTADTMEVMCDVSLTERMIEKVVNDTGACMVWGGSVNLAPADDRFIEVEHPMSVNAEGQLLASVMAKKKSVGATHVLIDIPVGKGAKIKDLKQARHLRARFREVGMKLGMKVHAVITDGSQPIGNGIGPALEARDILFVLNNDERAPKDLKKKSIWLAAEAMGMHAHIKNPKKLARELLANGSAHRKFMEILKAQGARVTDPGRIKLGRFTYDYKAPKSGKIVELDNKPISRVGRVAGAPLDQGAGIFIYKRVGDRVRKGEKVFTIYAESKDKLSFAKGFFRKFDGVKIR